MAPSRAAVADLDRAAPYYVRGAAAPADDEVGFPVRLSTADPKPLRITVRTEHCDCIWNATVHWRDGNRAISAVLDDHGHPFETTSVTGDQGVNWVNSSNADAATGWHTDPLTAG